MLGRRGYALMIYLSVVLMPPRLNVISYHMEYSEPKYKHADSNLRIVSAESVEDE